MAVTTASSREWGRAHTTSASDAGPLLCVASLCGGAGATTLALLIGTAAVRATGRPVLVCDTGGLTAGLAVHAGVASPLSLAQATARLAAGRPISARQLVTRTPSGLRIIARPPHPPPDGDEEGLRRLLSDARRAHRLTVVDCTTIGGALERHARALASHTIWVLPATSTGLRRASHALEAIPPATGRELLVARRDPQLSRPPLRAIGALAERRGAPLALMPAVGDLAVTGHTAALDAAALTLQAIAAFLRR